MDTLKIMLLVIFFVIFFSFLEYGTEYLYPGSGKSLYVGFIATSFALLINLIYKINNLNKKMDEILKKINKKCY